MNQKSGMASGIVVLVAILPFLLVPCWAQKNKPSPPPQPAADPAIAYIGYRSWAHTDLMVMNADGTNEKILLSRDTGGYFSPAWSPDSNRIAYCGNVPGGYGIYMMNKDGSNQCRVVSMAQDCMTAGDPSWSPDGSKILYMDTVFEPTQNTELFLVDAACNDADPNPSKTNLTNTPDLHEYDPDWSADGTRIATNAADSSTWWDLYLYELEQTSEPPSWTVRTRVNLTAGTQFSGNCCMRPNWPNSSDDKLVIDHYATGDIYIVDVLNPYFPEFTNITKTLEIPENFPAWSPDDSQIVFSRDREIWVMNPDGSNAKKLAAPSKTDRWTRLRYSDWRPCCPTCATPCAP